MLETLKGAALYVAGAIVLGIVGAGTYLASQSILTGSDWLVIATAVLAGTGIVTTAHTTSTGTVRALMTPPPGSATQVAPPAPPGVAGPVTTPEAERTHPVLTENI